MADLERFVSAQDRVTDAVSRELAAGSKQSHWMWFVFPQIAGLGHSSTAQHYAMASLDEAQAYLKHPVLGARLREWTGLVLDVDGKSAQHIFGYPDDLKFRSSMTLFERAAEAAGDDADVFRQALEKYYDGSPDEKTLALLGRDA
jgi:uncharacterized protein (DUF1810 family)